MAQLTNMKAAHQERTAHEPRDSQFHKVILKRIDEINDSIRIYRLEIPNRDTIHFIPGQWLDVFVPSVPKAGGFTITSPPSKAIPSDTSAGYLELAIKKSPDNPVAHWLWKQPVSEILNSELNVRVGGSFVWPPPPRDIDLSTLRKAVFGAGGMGINPLVSIISHLAEQSDVPFEVEVLYSLKDPGGEREADGMLFVERLASIFAREKLRGELKLFLTRVEGVEVGDGPDYVACNEVEVPFQSRRITIDDIKAAVGQDAAAAVIYICGVPAMTDQFVEELTCNDPAMEPARVLFEKWW
ncbi:NADH-cytochrome b-5 reductase [Coniochaeta sp. 2T2.1]|nr:NADH-cytochrome b-5 reductase [Coniochaeta sp. 2T2.1]